MSHLLTVVPSNIEKWKGKGISTASVPFEKPGGGERNRTRGREKQNYQAFKLGGERVPAPILDAAAIIWQAARFLPD